MFDRFVIHLSESLCEHATDRYQCFVEDSGNRSRPGFWLVVRCIVCRAQAELSPEELQGQIQIVAPDSVERLVGRTNAPLTEYDKKFLRNLKIAPE
jgi:hypothetical protein